MNPRTPIRLRRNQRPGRIVSEVPRAPHQGRMFVVRLEGLRQVAHVTEREIEVVGAGEEARR